MSETPIDQSLQKIRFLFRISGITIDDRQKSWKEVAIYLFHFVWIGTDLVLGINWLYEGVSKGLQFTELTYVMPCFTLGLVAEFKTIFFVRNEKKILKLIKTLRLLEEIKISNNPLERKMVKRETMILGTLIKVLITVNGILLMMFNLGPLILTGVKFFMTGELELYLPFLDIYPFDSYDLKYWPYAYIHEVWTSCIVLTDIFAVDFFFYICCTHIKIQFKCLQRELEQLIPGTGLEIDDDVREKLNELVKWHQDIISMSDLLEVIYSKSTLFNYISSSVIICLAGFDVTVIQDIAIVITFATITLVGMLQIFFLCFFGDMLMKSSTEVSTAAYNCRWYIADIPTRKTILLMQTRAQEPCKITAAGFADVNLRAFMKIISTSWSYFALLQTIYGSL
uniref:Odorant receptor n=1 Tax=Glyphodes pyloalis TaxID=1242752 RepID=A0A6M3GXE4_GLYPY|nr:olfactory receptor [Glyphodes pyloalis]